MTRVAWLPLQLCDPAKQERGAEEECEYSHAAARFIEKAIRLLEPSKTERSDRVPALRQYDDWLIVYMYSTGLNACACDPGSWSATRHRGRSRDAGQTFLVNFFFFLGKSTDPLIDSTSNDHAMSIDTDSASKASGPSFESKMLKEEKRRRKEAKRAKKAAKAASASAPATVSAVPSTLTSAGPSTAPQSPAPQVESAPDASLIMDEQQRRKEAKEAKKRKRAAETGADPAAGTRDTNDVGESSKAPSTSATPVSEPLGDADKPRKKSKKDKQVVSGGSTAEPADSALASSSKPAPISVPTTFTAAHKAYLSDQGITLSPSLYPPMLDIASLPVSSSISSFLSRFPKPTPIQACAWPPLLAGRDVVGVAETGSGKTLGFGVPGMQLLSGLSAGSSGGEGKKKQKKSKKNGGGVIQLLVLAPTRELALQSHETLADLGKAMGIESVCLYGGVGKDSQLAALAKESTRIVVGTPGRVLDLADSGEMDLST